MGAARIEALIVAALLALCLAVWVAAPVARTAWRALRDLSRRDPAAAALFAALALGATLCGGGKPQPPPPPPASAPAVIWLYIHPATGILLPVGAPILEDLP